MAAYSAQLRGASRVFVVDRVPERLAVAERIGCIAIDFTQGDAVDQIIELNEGMVDRSVDAVGYQAVNATGSAEKPNIVLENMIRVTRACGGLGIPGLYVPRLVLSSLNLLFLGTNERLTVTRVRLMPLLHRAWSVSVLESCSKRQVSACSLHVQSTNILQGLSLATGQCNVKAYNRYLRDMIVAGKAKPSFVVSHELSIDDAEIAYHKFDKREDGFTKVLLHPNGNIDQISAKI